MSQVLGGRRAGLLLHPTSLPGAREQGDLGPEAYRFVEFLARSGLSVWQTLPLGPTHEDSSPYQCLSVHAGNPRLINPELLVEWGWMAEKGFNPEGSCGDWLAVAHNGFLRHGGEAAQAEYRDFVQAHDHWLQDYALYTALRAEQQDRSWVQWPASLRDRESDALEEARRRLAATIEGVRFEQFVFFRQWHQLRHYANERQVLLFGDIPIFVAHDSAEVWAHRELFSVDEHGQARKVAGVPPDYFSETGQRWGNPQYDWERMQAGNFQWWVERIATQLDLFDLVRIDHFRGFEAYWEIDAASELAVDGRWVKAPGEALFECLQACFDPLPLVAEDLGTITPEVDALRARFGLPGMKVLQFAFDGDPKNLYLPHHHETDSVVYTGTHDNDTSLGWFNALDARQQAMVRGYLANSQEEMPWLLVRAAFMSVARLAMVPMQDVLAMGSDQRMNRPGTDEGNWRWRFQWEQVPEGLEQRIRHLVEVYDRLP
ncbi:MAG: 4-alpha-glucanotransferase [Xanthomonadaceae bacterium]|nr:4-alpha-glucanotransferase [Xanthomonadaceae bacterium]